MFTIQTQSQPIFQVNISMCYILPLKKTVHVRPSTGFFPTVKNALLKPLSKAVIVVMFWSLPVLSVFILQYYAFTKTIHYGKSGTVLARLYSYPPGRIRQCQMMAHCHIPASLTYHIPQGSVLQSMLFMLYTKTISSCFQYHVFHHYPFADDRLLYCSKSPKTTQSAVSTT